MPQRSSGYFRLLVDRKPVLTEKDTVVLADFTNSTGDPVFDGTLRQGLSVQLEQSPFLSLIGEERIRQTLQLMGQPADARLTPELARDICVRTGSAATLDGSIASLGSKYVLGMRARNCGSGERSSTKNRCKPPEKKDVLNALTQIATKFRTRVGESLSSIREHDTPLPEATTSSLDALKAFTWGDVQQRRNVEDLAAVPFISTPSSSIRILPSLTPASAVSTPTWDKSELSRQYRETAFQLRDRTSEHERLYITAHYYLDSGQFDKGMEAWELYKQTYPRDAIPLKNLAMEHDLLGNRVSPKEAFEGLELCERKLSCTVLRGLDGSNPVRLLGETLTYLLNSRYCEVDRLSSTAVELFGRVALGWARVQAGVSRLDPYPGSV
jgi:hypothetical protein